MDKKKQQANAAGTYGMNMRHRHAEWTCIMDIPHGNAAGTLSMDLQH
jgi:hypothetical protein